MSGKVGQPKKIESPEVLAQLWQEFKAKCDSEVKHVASAGKLVAIPAPRVYTLEQFQQHCRITRMTWSRYRNRRRYSDTVKEIEEAVFARKKDALVNQEGSTTGLIFDMKANYGINDKTIIDATVDGSYDITLNLGGPAATQPAAQDEVEEE